VFAKQLVARRWSGNPIRAARASFRTCSFESSHSAFNGPENISPNFAPGPGSHSASAIAANWHTICRCAAFFDVARDTKNRATLGCCAHLDTSNSPNFALFAMICVP
jgi:hypothetical protein